MRAEYLDQTDLKLRRPSALRDLRLIDPHRWNFPVHEYSRQIQLNLETDLNIRVSQDCEAPLMTYIDVGPIYGRRPPHCKPSVWNLVQAGPLRVSQLFVLHRFFEARSVLH